jgi:hypothetical protein
VQAVICTPSHLPRWIRSLADALERELPVAKRRVLPDGSRDDVSTWLDDALSDAVLDGSVRGPLHADVLALVDLLANLGHVSRFRLRVLVGEPSNECGYHVDTVAPGAPRWGLLRVYNGPCTEYVDPCDVRSTAEFYRYLGRRERLERSRAEARREGNVPAACSIEVEIADLDTRTPFLKRPDAIQLVPAGSIVAFKHADIRDHWSNTCRDPGWIHCSPMAGSPRLVVNVTSPQWARDIGR